MQRLARRDEEIAQPAWPGRCGRYENIGFGVVGDVVVDDVAHAPRRCPGSHVGGVMMRSMLPARSCSTVRSRSDCCRSPFSAAAE